MTSPSAFSMASSSQSSLNIGSPSSMFHEELTLRVRNKLKTEKVNLWEPPFTKAGGERDDGAATQELVDRYSRELNLDKETVATIIQELRAHSLAKLAANQKFTEKGVASLKVKLAGNVPPEITERTITVEISLFVSGQDLKQLISQQCRVDRDALKLISSGKVIDDFSMLKEQGVKQFGRVMAICLTETEQEARQQQQQAQRIQQTREGAHLLSNRDEVDDNSNYYLQIADQSGKPLDLPKAEKKALTFAMTLHEKGRAAVKKKEYGEALLLLLEADSEFKKCRADILQCVDNYALVCLDIVWCYLCLRNVSDLPDAQLKLQTCDDCFRRSYGPNLERLALVKGGTGTEKALFLRLHLLQGILAFHQHRKQEAALLLDRAESELRALQIDDGLISQVMDMGFSSQEARLGLRLTEGNVTMAVAHIMNRRQEKEEIRQKEKEKKRQRKIAKKLGKTANGDAVNIELYESLKSMGFPKGAASEALKQTNNDITLALEVLNTRPELLSLPDPEAEPFDVTDDMVAQVMAIGFSPEAARAALQHTQSIERAVQELVQRQGTVPQEWLDALMAEAASPQPSSSDGRRIKSPEELEREKKLIESVIEDLPEGEEDHLDINLREEEQFLLEYKAYLMSADT